MEGKLHVTEATRRDLTKDTAFQWTLNVWKCDEQVRAAWSVVMGAAGRGWFSL